MIGFVNVPVTAADVLVVALVVVLVVAAVGVPPAVQAMHCE